MAGALVVKEAQGAGAGGAVVLCDCAGVAGRVAGIDGAVDGNKADTHLFGASAICLKKKVSRVAAQADATRRAVAAVDLRTAAA